MKPLSVAISPCPNDTFIFGAWALGLASCNLDCRFFWHDVQELNTGALSATWDVIKVSAAAALRLEDTYDILNCGGAFGLEHGPKIVVRPGFQGHPKVIAVPGLDTTAMLVLRAALGDTFTPVPMIFHQIVQAVQDGAADAGLLIHETALVYQRYGLALYLDLGQWWQEHARLPLPLGCIVACKTLGPAIRADLEDTIRDSIRAARNHTDAVMPLVQSLARELDAATLKQHIAAYVNDFSLNMGSQGQAALALLKTFQEPL